MSQYKPTRYLIMKHQLEYFYLIDTDHIVNAITQEFKESGNAHILNTIFKHVFKGASCYTDYLCLDSYHPFFNENAHKPIIRGLCQLLYLALQNNCILNAFFHILSTESSAIPVSEKNRYHIQSVIMDMIKGNQLKEPPKGTKDPQFFYNRKRIFHNENNKDIYNYQILQALNTAMNHEAGDVPVNTLQYLSPAANFLFIEDVCKKFSVLLHNNRNILNKYNSLYNTFSEQKNNYKNNIDKLVFESEINSIFGFSFFESVSQYIDSIHKSSLSSGKCLRDLEGEPFNNIILQAANLPLFFNKELFLKFACCAFLNSPKTDYSYFEESVRTLMRRVSSSTAKQQQVIDGLDLMRKFFQVLTSVTLPVLFSLWEVVVYELNQQNLNIKIGLDCYGNYLSDNYSSIIYNYLLIPDNIISGWGSPAFTSKNALNNKHFDNNFFARYIERNKSMNKNINAQKNTDGHDIINKYASQYSVNVTQQLIRSYCNIHPLKECRCPYFFLKENELKTYSPLSNLITPLLYTQFPSDKPDGIAKDTFLSRHRSSLFDYLFSKD